MSIFRVFFEPRGYQFVLNTRFFEIFSHDLQSISNVNCIFAQNIEIC